MVRHHKYVCDCEVRDSIPVCEIVTCSSVEGAGAYTFVQACGVLCWCGAMVVGWEDMLSWLCYVRLLGVCASVSPPSEIPIHFWRPSPPGRLCVLTVIVTVPSLCVPMRPLCVSHPRLSFAFCPILPLVDGGDGRRTWGIVKEKSRYHCEYDQTKDGTKRRRERGETP